MHQHPLSHSQPLLKHATQLPEDIEQVLALGIVLRDIEVGDPSGVVVCQGAGGKVAAHDCEDEGYVVGGEEGGVGGGVGAGGGG